METPPRHTFRQLNYKLFQHQPLQSTTFLRDLDLSEWRNVKVAQEQLNCSPLHWGNQVHGTELQEVTPQSPQIVGNCDGLMTDHPGVGLLIRHADCQAAVLYDPRGHAVCAVHSGWRGSVQNIYGKAIQAMHDRYGSKPVDLLVSISPSLGPSAAEFRNYREEIPEEYWGFQVKPTYFDFWALSRHQLVAAGVSTSNIEIAGKCTYESPLDFFSYRREQDIGRHGTAVVLD